MSAAHRAQLEAVHTERDKLVAVSTTHEVLLCHALHEQDEALAHLEEEHEHALRVHAESTAALQAQAEQQLEELSAAHRAQVDTLRAERDELAAVADARETVLRDALIQQDATSEALGEMHTSAERRAAALDRRLSVGNAMRDAQGRVLARGQGPSGTAALHNRAGSSIDNKLEQAAQDAATAYQRSLVARALTEQHARVITVPEGADADAQRAASLVRDGRAARPARRWSLTIDRMTR